MSPNDSILLTADGQPLPIDTSVDPSDETIAIDVLGALTGDGLAKANARRAEAKALRKAILLGLRARKRQAGSAERLALANMREYVKTLRTSAELERFARVVGIEVQA